MNFKEIIGLAGPVLVIALSLVAIKNTENGWKRFWKAVLLIVVVLLIYRLINTYLDFQERKQDAINTVCHPLLSTYDSAACQKLRD